MSIRIWEEIARKKKQVEDQRETILNAFKQRKIVDEMGQVRAEKLFQPITNLLGKPREEKDEEKFPDYAMAGEDINYMHELPFAGEEDEDPYADLEPFEEADQEDLGSSEGQSGSEKVKDYSGFIQWLQKHGYESDEIIPLPEKSSPAASAFPDPEEITPLAGPPALSDPEELEEEVAAAAFLPGPSGDKAEAAPPRYSAATRWDEPPKYKEPRDENSSNLSTLKRFIKNNEGQPGAKITTEKSKFLGYTVDKAREKVYEIYTERAKKVLEKGDKKSAIGQKDLGPYDGKTNEEMREMIDEFEKGKEQTGTGLQLPVLRPFPPINTLINRLSLGISSIFAGNTSVKLREEVRAIANLLHKAGIISSEQKKKVLALK